MPKLNYLIIFLFRRYKIILNLTNLLVSNKICFMYGLYIYTNDFFSCSFKKTLKNPQISQLFDFNVHRFFRTILDL